MCLLTLNTDQMDNEGEVRNILEMPKQALSEIIQNKQNYPELIHEIIVPKVDEQESTVSSYSSPLRVQFLYDYWYVY